MNIPRIFFWKEDQKCQSLCQFTGGYCVYPDMSDFMAPYYGCGSESPDYRTHLRWLARHCKWRQRQGQDMGIESIEIMGYNEHTIWLFKSLPWKITMLLIGQPSISMGHGFHGKLLVITRW